VSEKLIKFRLDYPLRECIALAESLRDKFELSLCEVVPSDAGSGDTLNGIAVCAAAHQKASEKPLALDMGRKAAATSVA